VSADPLADAGDISHLSGLYQWVGFDSDASGETNVTTVFSQTGASQGVLTFGGLDGAGEFAGALSSFDDFGTALVETEDLSGVAEFVVGLSLSSGPGDIEFVVEDEDSRSSVLLTGVTASEQFYRISKSLFSGIDWTKVKSIVVTAAAGNVASSGTLNIRLGDHPFTVPVPTVMPDTNATAADITLFPGLRQVLAFDSNPPANADGTANVMQLSSTMFNVYYNVTNDDSFGGGICTFDDFETTQKESWDLSGFSEFVVGLQLGSGNGMIEFIFEDADGAQSKVMLLNIGTTEQFYRISKSLFSGIDWTRISNTVMTVVNKQVSEPQGILKVRLGNLPHTPLTIVSGTTYSATDLSVLNGTPNVISGSGNTVNGQANAIMNLTQTSANGFHYEYDLSPSNTSFTFALISNGEFVNNAFVGEYLSFADKRIVIAARGSAGQRMKIEIRDRDQLKAIFILELQPYLQNFVLNLSGGSIPPNFAYTHIADITFVQDWNIGSSLLNDVVTVETRGLDYIPPMPDGDLEANRSGLVQSALRYFEDGIDPATHFPYDSMGANGVIPGKYTQPTLIGFYLQILGEVVKGAIDNGMTRAQALAEISAVLTSLLNVQTNYGWNGLIPWLNLEPLGMSEKKVALGDNANLAQSIATMIGALEGAGLAAAQLDPIRNNAHLFINNQADGYAAFVDPVWGLFRGDYVWTTNPAAGTFQNYIDRVGSEFRGAVAFLRAYFPAKVPASVWDNLKIVSNNNYVDRDGNIIQNLAAWDGGAFQMFWPSLRNDELSFIGFRNVLYNQLVTQLDYSYQNRLPGIASASLIPGNGYSGAVGIPQISEANMDPGATNIIIGDVGSTYSLAAAMCIDPYAVLGWLDSIANLSNLNGSYGFFDSARSNSEISRSYIGVDVASMILGLTGGGASDFTTYLRNHGLESAYNQLYDSMSQKLAIAKTDAVFPNAPLFPDRSLAVFSNIESEGSINYFDAATTEKYGVRLTYSDLRGTDSGHFWKLDELYDASANQLRINYSARNTPDKVRIELKDASGTVVYRTMITLDQGAEFRLIVISLPDSSLLQAVKEIDLVVDADADSDPDGAATADFTIHSINFQRLPTVSLTPAAGLGAADVTTLPSGGTVVIDTAENGSGLASRVGNVSNLHYDVTAPGARVTFRIDFDQNRTGASKDFSGFSGIVFGLDSAQVDSVKIEIEDASGMKMTAHVSNVDVSRNYYKFLKSLAAERGVDMSRVKAISLTVDGSSVSSGNEIGDLHLEIGGL